MIYDKEQFGLNPKSLTKCHLGLTKTHFVQKQTKSAERWGMHSFPKPPIGVLTSTWNPRTKALTKSAAFVSEAMSCVSLQVWNKGKHVTHIHTCVHTKQDHVHHRKIDPGCVKTYFDFNVPGFEIESDLKLQVLDNWSKNL